MEQGKWMESFELTTEMTEELSAGKPSDQSHLFWLLKQGKIPFEKYSLWAQKEFRLPVLQNPFFAKEPQSEVLKLAKEHSDLWTQELLPVAMWKNTLYVACLEPPAELPIDTPYQLTIADPTGLEKWWEQLPLSSSSVSADTQITGTVIPTINFPSSKDSDTQTSSSEIQASDSLQISSAFNENSIDWQKIAEQTFAKMEKYYIQSMLVTLNGRNLWPKTWNAKWSRSADENAIPIPLGAPSIFQVVFKTQKPYHGCVFKNSINDQFFKFWNEEKTPKHMTIVPIIAQGEIRAMLLGTAEPDIKFNKSLKAMEKWAKEISDSLNNNQASQAA